MAARIARQIEYTDYLAHHGILGQRWGKRNGPPYPLGSSDHSASEKKAQWRKSLDKPSKSSHTESSSENKKHGLTDKQKRAIKIGAAVAATALVAYGSYRLAKSGKLDPLIAKGRQAVGQILGKSGDAASTNPRMTRQAATQTVNGIRKLAKPESLSETLKNVNPHLGDRAYKNNCTFCSVTSFLRQQGYDVAAGKTPGAKPQDLGSVVEKCFKNAKVLDGSATKFGRSRQDAAEMLLKRYGQNAEGVCSIQWKKEVADGGHAFNWKIKDGVVSFFDSQSGRDDSFVSKYWSRGMIDPNGGLHLARLDGLEINFDAIKEILE